MASRPSRLYLGPLSLQLQWGSSSLCLHLGQLSLIAMDFRTFSCTSSLHPYGSCGLLLLSSFTLVLGHSAFSSVLQSPGPDPVAHHCGSALPSRTFNVAGPVNSSASYRVSTTTGSISLLSVPHLSPHPPCSVGQFLRRRAAPSRRGE